MENSLLIVGAGGLGARVGRLWRSQFPEARVTAVTQTTTRHGELSAQGFAVSTGCMGLAVHPSILIAAPASAQTPALLQSALDLWSGEGVILLISSTGIYTESENGRVDENSPTLTAGPLFEAERQIRQAGGSVLRLAGLYSKERGPQRSYLKNERAAGPAEGLMNLIHYDDAATLSVAALLRGTRCAVYLGAEDDAPTRFEFAKFVFATSDRPERFENFKFAEGPLGKRCVTDRTRQFLKWTPDHNFRKSLID